jgi:chromosome segregation ATPase|tara:strand:- start:802 stop:1407 length:606 start_codon:yes stop_codon:yes gene_type:complete
MEELHKLDEQLSTTQSQQTQLSDNIKNQKLSISQHSSELNNIKDFEKKIENIDFQNDSDSTLKTKIESLPNVENISRNISPMKARTVSIQSDTVFLSGAKSSSSETLPQLEERKEKLKLEILDVLKKIQDINQSISQKQTDINTKNTEIQNEESVLIEKQAIVDEYQQKIKDFQDRNSTEINNYKNARREYISNANILKRE